MHMDGIDLNWLFFMMVLIRGDDEKNNVSLAAGNLLLNAF